MDDKWSRHDALMYRALSLFPEKLEKKFLDANDFRNHFTDFYGRPVQDIAKALYQYGQNGYFKPEIKLALEYLEQGKALDKVTIALNKLHPESATMPDEYRGLGEQVYYKVKAEQPLTVAEVRSLPDRANPYLAFKLSNIDRQRLHKELAVYDNDKFQPSRLEKSKTTESTVRTARVFMDGRSINILVADKVYTIAKLYQDGSHYNFMRFLTDPNNFDFPISYEEISHLDGCEDIKNMSEHIRHCGFSGSLKEAFFGTKKNKLKNKLHFLATANLNAKQYSAVKKQALKVENKS